MWPGCRLLVLLLAALTFAGCSQKGAPEPLLIGHLAPSSGPDKVMSDHAKQAILLAVQEVNDPNKPENRIAGREVTVLHPVYPPGDLEVLQPIAVRLITVNKVVGLLGGADVVQAERLGRAAQPYDVPLLTPASLPSQLLGGHIFSVSPGQAFEGEVLARFAAQELKAERVAVLADSRSTASAAVTAAFVQEFSRKSGKLAQEWTYAKDAEQAALAERVKEEQIQAIVYAGAVADLRNLRAAFQKLGITVPILFAGAGTQVTTLQADRKASTGLYLATTFVADGGLAAGQEFIKTYQDRFHQPPELHAALAYDAIRVLFEAMRRAKTPTAPKIRAELANTTNGFDSLTGPLTFNTDHSARRPLFVVRLEDGQLRMLKRYGPDEK
jgi:branched-chain amino acid transport system substrate-binding protein